jgi:peptidyl-prolyl cis-trans isomerase D
MSIIQTIREKGAKISVILIALALLGFILTDYVAGKNRGGGGGNNSTTIGSVNGVSINQTEFQKDIDATEEMMKQQGYPQGANTTQQAVEQTWNQHVSRILYNDEFEKLGINVTSKELGDILYGVNAPDDLKRQFADEATGQYNPIKAKQAIDQMLNDKKTPVAQKDQFNNYLVQLKLQRKSEKYNAMIANSSNVPRWFVEKQNADNSQLAKISYVKEVYSSIVDSTIKIEDKEIADYISKHKDDFKQTESRNISYVSFSASPVTADSIDAKDRLLKLKQKFDSTTNVKEFLAGEGSENYYDGYINGKAIQIVGKDSIFRTPVGGTYGPYLDGSTYVLARMMGVKQMGDTAKFRHILIATQQTDPQTRQVQTVREDADAKKLIDSIKILIDNGANFDSVTAKLSEDPGSKDKGGVYDKVPSGQMTPPINDFIFLRPVGTKEVVKSEFGYHYIELLSQKGSGTGYKIAYLPMDIVASQETDNAAMNKANQFAGDAKNQKTFDDAYEKTVKPLGIVKMLGMGILPNDAGVQNLAPSRQFVREIYKASRGEVLKPERIGNDYVVAIVTDIFEEGTKSVASARSSVEPILRNEKKAEILKKKIGNVTTLEPAAAVLAKPIETVDSIRMSLRTTSALGYEPKVIGAAFYPSNKGKVITEAIAGTNGVYVVRVENVSATAVEGNVTDQRKALTQQAKQSGSNPIGALRDAATIKDKRADKY